MQVIKGQKDQEMTRGLGLLSHQEIEIVIKNDKRDGDDWLCACWLFEL